MLILVVYDDGTHDLVESYMLDYLITTRRVVQFCRSSGWARVGRDPVRSGRTDYCGIERRFRARKATLSAPLARSSG